MERSELGTFLPFGNGRSYGDSCLNDGGTLLDVRGLDRFIHFDPHNGILHCEAGVLLAEVLDLVVPQGWFLPVTPGTRYVTLGGAIANDVHGKNHHRAGTFGCHVRSFELIRSDGTRLSCSDAENPEWFRASIGGLGLTGIIVRVELTLKRISNPYIRKETIRFSSLEEFLMLSQESDRNFEYTVAWVDCTAPRDSRGRGLFFRGNHAPPGVRVRDSYNKRSLPFPVKAPVSLVSRHAVATFNRCYFHAARLGTSVVHYLPFFYPLDAIREWNRIYGPRGFMQYQCVVPSADAVGVLKEALRRISRAETGSFLAVLKQFGHVSSPGLMSFPRPGVTLSLDFPNQGPRTLSLLDSLDELVTAAGGAVYPAKDARMSAQSFQRYFPQWEELLSYVDPNISSSFWRRVTGVTS